MSKERVIEVTLKFQIKDQNTFPPVSCICKISAKPEGGALIQSSHKYEGSSDRDVVETITRMDPFKAKISDVVKQVLNEIQRSKKPTADAAPEESTPSTSEVSDERKKYDQAREKHYAKIAQELSGKKIGEIRHFCTKHGLSTTTGGKKKEVVIQEIIEEIRQKEALPEE